VKCVASLGAALKGRPLLGARLHGPTLRLNGRLNRGWGWGFWAGAVGLGLRLRLRLRLRLEAEAEAEDGG